MGSNQEVRQRKRPKQKSNAQIPTANDVSNDNLGLVEEFGLTRRKDVQQMLLVGWKILGFIVLIYCGNWFSWYVQTLHENQMWFTNIQEVEREISLRTECGLYYSYYKQLIHSPSFKQGLHDLTVDNATEHSRTINILERFNVYQEVVLAYLYRLLIPYLGKLTVQPILFYVYSIFKLNGFYVSVLFGISWLLTDGNWLAGLLTAVFYIVNLEDTTRVSYTVNLRECFGFPFFWCQIFFLCLFLKRYPVEKAWKHFLLCVAIFVFTSLFGITWQFNQFILLLQSASVYAIGVLHLVPEWKVRRVLFVQASALLAVCLTQFGQPMLLGSLLLAFIPGAVLSLYLCRGWTISGGIVTGTLKIIIQVAFTLILTVLFHVSLKRSLKLEADDHIFKFLQGKFGFADPRDFESRIYICHGAFKFLDNDFYYRTSYTFLLPLYVIFAVGSLLIIGKDILYEWCAPIMLVKTKYVPYDRNDITDKMYYFNRRPEIAFLVLQSAFSSVLAMMALRMKYLWAPHMCILASIFIGDKEMWRKIYLFVKIRKAQLAAVLTSGLLCFTLTCVNVYNYSSVYSQQMSDLREFYDPDTVELMNWINTNTKPNESFGGSMQLLAGVKCCTGRHLTNHPHFEDKFLRDRTRQVYQIYGRRKPEDVYKILKSFDTNYIILEDSICLARSDGCRTPDLVDLDNWHIPDYGTTQLEGLKKSNVPRFCLEIRNGAEEYTKYFKLVLENRTFRVFKLL